MRVLEIINTLNMGGAETLLCDLVPALMQLGAQVDILCLSGLTFPLEKELAMKGIKAVHTAPQSPYSPLQIFGVKKQILAGNYDVIHSHLFPAQLWTVIGARMANANVPLVTTEHNTWNRRRREWFRPLDRWMYRRYSAIACIGAATESALQAWISGDPLPSRVILNGINVERFSHATCLSDFQPSAKTVTTLMCVASLNDRKGQEVLLQAASLLPDTEVWLVGEGPKRTDLERLVKELHLGERVRFLGNRRDIPDLLHAADIYVQPSHWEGFGIATVEAMAAGLPVVASNVAGLREVVGDAGLLFAPGSVSDLKECIARLVSKPDLRQEVASRASLRARQFSIDSTATEYLQLYQSVCPETKPPVSGQPIPEHPRPE